MALSESTNSTPFHHHSAFSMTLEDVHSDDGALRFIAPMVLCFIFSIGLLGNTCVIAIVRRCSCHQHQLLSQPPVLPLILLSMAFADLFLLLLVCPLSALAFAQETWTLGETLCQIVRPVEFVIQMGTVLHLAAMSIDAWLVLAFPDAYDSWKNRTNTIIGCALIWLLSIMFALPLWANAGIVQTSDGGRLFCTIKWPDDGYPLSCPLYMAVFGFLAPITIIVIALLWIVINSKSSREQLHHNSHSSEEEPETTQSDNGHGSRGEHQQQQDSNTESVQRHESCVRLVTHLTFALLVSWLPYNIVPFFVPIYSFSESTASINLTYADTRLYTTIACYAYAFSCVKPLLYIFHLPDIRRGFVDFVPRRGRGAGGGSGTTTTTQHTFITNPTDIHQGIGRYRDRLIGTGVLSRTSNRRGPNGSAVWSIHGFPGSIISSVGGTDDVLSPKDRNLTV